MQYNNQKGFTILELILSIFILSVAVAGIFGSFSLMVNLSSNTSDRLVAVYLAQEGLEIITNIRDDNWLNKNSWYQGIYPECQSGCQIDYTSDLNNIRVWAEPGEYLKINADGFYGYGALSQGATKFKRKITVTQLDDSAIKVTVTVFWDQKVSILNPSAKQGAFSAEVVLYNWQEKQ